MGRKFGKIGVILGAILVSLPVQAENYAFLVAVQDYDVKTLGPLKFARSDIEEFASVLKTSGFKPENIVLMSDKATELRYAAESEKIRKQLDILLAGLVEGDTLIVALAGHGVQFQGEDKSYFCPADADLDDPKRTRLLLISELYQKLKESPAQRKMLIVDACRSDPASTLGRSRESLKLASITRPQAEPIPKGVVAFFSCAAGQEAFEWPELKHGIFFHFLLEGWQGAADDGDQLITLDEIVSYTKLRTQTFARLKLDAAQTPQLKSNFQGTWILRDLKTRNAPDEVRKPGPVIASRTPVTIFGSPSSTSEFGVTQGKSEPTFTLKGPTTKSTAKPAKAAPRTALQAAPKAAPSTAPKVYPQAQPGPGLVQLGGGILPEPVQTVIPSLTAAQRDRNRDLILRVRGGVTDEEKVAAARQIRALGEEAEEILKTLCAGLVERNERVRMLSSQALAMIDPEFHKFAVDIADGRQTYVTEQERISSERLRIRDFEGPPTRKTPKFGKLSRAVIPILWSHLEKSDPTNHLANSRSTGDTSRQYRQALDALCDLAPEDKKLGALLVKLIKSPDERTSVLAMRRLTDMEAAASRTEVVGALMMLLQRPVAQMGRRVNFSQFRSEEQTTAAVQALGKLSPYAKGARDLVRRVQASSMGSVRAATDAALRRIDEG